MRIIIITILFVISGASAHIAMRPVVIKADSIKIKNTVSATARSGPGGDASIDIKVRTESNGETVENLHIHEKTTEATSTIEKEVRREAGASQTHIKARIESGSLDRAYEKSDAGEAIRKPNNRSSRVEEPSNRATSTASSLSRVVESRGSFIAFLTGWFLARLSWLF
jgi:hypothetical protein